MRATMKAVELRGLALVALIGLGMLAAPAPAGAWWHRGHWGGGFYVAPPVYVPPPVYVAPPPVYVPPPAYVAPPVYAAPPATYAGPPPAGQCSAGPYVCPLAAPAVAGQSCACDTPQGRIWGMTR